VSKVIKTITIWLKFTLQRALGGIQKMTFTDEELVEHCLGGDKNSYAQLVERHKRMVFNVAYRILGNTEDAEDAAQEVFLRAYLALPRFRKKSKFSTWLYSIVSNVCITKKKKKDKYANFIEASMQSDSQMENASDNPEGILEKREFADRVQQLVASLPARYSIIITLRYFREFSYDEIAETLGLPIGTVKVRLFRAKEMLKKLAVKHNLKP